MLGVYSAAWEDDLSHLHNFQGVLTFYRWEPPLRGVPWLAWGSQLVKVLNPGLSESSQGRVPWGLQGFHMLPHRAETSGVVTVSSGTQDALRAS